MVSCPDCKEIVTTKPVKSWRYGHYQVKSFNCKICGLQFREYSQNGKTVFILKQKKGRGFVKAL